MPARTGSGTWACGFRMIRDPHRYPLGVRPSSDPIPPWTSRHSRVAKSSTAPVTARPSGSTVPEDVDGREDGHRSTSHCKHRVQSASNQHPISTQPAPDQHPISTQCQCGQQVEVYRTAHAGWHVVLRCVPGGGFPEHPVHGGDGLDERVSVLPGRRVTVTSCAAPVLLAPFKLVGVGHQIEAVRQPVVVEHDEGVAELFQRLEILK